MSDTGGPGPTTTDVSATPTRMVLRTILLAISAVILFPALLGSATHGAWPALMERIGIWRWFAWGTCFVAMVITRFAGGPKRGA